MKGKEALCNYMCIEIESNTGIAFYESICTQFTHDFQSNDHKLKIKYIDQGWINPRLPWHIRPTGSEIEETIHMKWPNHIGCGLFLGDIRLE